MADLKVTVLNNELDSTSVGDLLHNPNDPSLREALFIANNNTEADSVTFATGGPIIDEFFGSFVGLFDLDAATGVLSFQNAPDFENPLDQGGDNFSWIGRWSLEGAPERRP